MMRWSWIAVAAAPGACSGDDTGPTIDARVLDAAPPADAPGVIGTRHARFRFGGTMPDEKKGEGSYSGARKYDDEAERYAHSGKVDDAADAAASAVDSSEGSELRAAEQEGKEHAAEEDPLLREDRDPPEYPNRRRGDYS